MRLCRFRHTQVIETVEYEHVFKLNEVELTNLLCDPAIADMPVAVVSVAGAFRKGKSFLLNFFIRYMRAMVCRLQILRAHTFIMCRRTAVRTVPNNGSHRSATNLTVSRGAAVASATRTVFCYGDIRLLFDEPTARRCV
jgi:hypothetical protein